MASKKKRPSIDDYMTLPAAFEHFKIPKATFYHWVKFGDLASDMIGATKIVLKTDVKKYIKEIDYIWAT